MDCAKLRRANRVTVGQTRRSLLLATGVMIGLSGPGIAAAADASGANKDATTQLGEIIVTAEKRDATVQKTPISITALKGADLQQAGITNLTAVAEQVPGVALKTGGPGQNEFEMRGLNSAGGNSPTVGFYLDDTSLTTFAYATAGKVVIDPDLYDLNRVEVLRGPQGTLYGSGSMGGTIRLISNQPVLDGYHASIDLTGSGTEGGGANGGVSAMVNVPIVPGQLALRVAGTEKSTSGWIDRIVLDPFPLPTDGGLTRGSVTTAPVSQVSRDVNWDHLQAIRATLLYQPTSRLSITPMIMLQQINSGGQSLIDNPPGNVEAHYQPYDSPEPVSDRFQLYALTVKYDFDGFQVVSATSHWTRTLTQVQDGAEVMQDVLGLPAFDVADGGLGVDPWTERDTATQTSEELRVTSTGKGAFQWQGGFYYGDLSSTTLQYSVDPAAGPLFGVTTLYHEFVPQDFDQKSLFGEVSYQITPSLKATAGVRYFTFDNTFKTTEYGFFGPYGDLTPGSSQSRAWDSGFNPKFNLAYEPSKDLTLYATVSKGFRPGGGNQIVPTSGTEEGDACEANLQAFGKTSNPATYGPDSVWNYEIGEKLRLFDDRLSINGSAYYEHWENIQREVTLNCGYIYSDNAGEAAIYGSELEVSARLGYGLTLSVNAGYTDAQYTQNSLETGVVKGEQLPDVPKWTSSQSLIYRHKISDDFTIVARAQNDYIGARTDVTYYIDNLPSYDLLSARIGITASQGWSAFFFVDNITNKHALLNAINSQVLNIPTMTRDTTNQPRTIGVDLTYGF
jgi:outer membrane receptor protein involved in Fe transport